MMSTKKVSLTSSNLTQEKLDELRRILPEAFSENKIDWEKLQAVLGDEIDERIEKFTFTWAGKSNAIKNVLIPSKATLSPARSESIQFDESENLFIEGDNLEVLKLLQKAYFEQVKMIYIDPPYNTGGDFVYRDNFTAPLENYLKQTGQKDGNGSNLTTNRETNGRYHSDWLSMMYPRLKLAWNLLRDDGVIFVSIDDNEVHHLRMILNEVFGEENFVDSICWKKKYGGGAKEKYLVSVHEYILIYAKNLLELPEILVAFNEEKARKFYKYKDENFETLGYYRTHPLEAVKSFDLRENLNFPLTAPDGTEVWPKRQWRWSKERFKEALSRNEVIFSKNNDGEWVLSSKQYLNDESGEQRKTKAQSVIDDIFTQEGTKEIVDIFGDAKVFSFPKPIRLVQRILEISGVAHNDIVLDFFAGSGTTAQAVLEQNKLDSGNRKFILVQLPEKTEKESEAFQAGYKTIADLAVERIRRVIKGYGDDPQPIDDGFKVFKLAESNYPENQFEFDPDKTEEESKKAFEAYLTKAKQMKLLDDDVDSLDVVYENIVKEGLSLNSTIIEQKISKNTVYLVADGERQILVCVDRKIGTETVNELTSQEYKGKVFICLDNALDDTAKANLGLNLELKTI